MSLEEAEAGLLGEVGEGIPMRDLLYVTPVSSTESTNNIVGDDNAQETNDSTKIETGSAIGETIDKDAELEDIEDRAPALRNAIRERDVETVKKLLADGVNLMSRDNAQMTPLHLCIQQYCYWNYEHNVPRNRCLPKEIKIIKEILSAAVRADNKYDILDCLDRKGRSPIYLAIECGFFEVVQALLESGANILKVSSKGETALHIAVQRPTILKYFLDRCHIDNSVDTDGYAAIHAAAKYDRVESFEWLKKKFGRKELMRRTSDGSTVLHVAAEHGSIEVAKFLLRTPYQSDLHIDNNGETPLNRSAKHGHKALTAMLLSHGAVLSDKGSQGRTAVKQIARRFTDPTKFFEDIFDENIIENDSSAICKERKVHVVYTALANNDGRGLSQIKVVEELVKCGQEELLIHPLIESLLYLKWKCIIPVVYTIIAIYAIFLASFNIFLITVFHVRDYKESNISQNETASPSIQCFNRWNDWFEVILIYLTIFLMVGQECVYIYLQRRRYFVLMESWVKLCLLALATVIPLAVRCEEPSPWLRHLVCVALLLSWLQAMLLMSRFPDWGYYVLMIQKVAYNIFKILLTSICLVTGFSFCFMIQYRSQSPFDGPWPAFVKTLVMMSSEFDYGDLFGSEYDTVLQDTKTVVRFLFVIFVIFIAIVLMNFMIGVAVSDINELNILGHIRRLEKQMELIITIDILIDLVLIKFFPGLLRRQFHDNISKDIESDEQWEVYYGTHSNNFDSYEETLTTELQNSITNVVKRKLQRKKEDYRRYERNTKLNEMYNTLMGMSEIPKQKTENSEVYKMEIKSMRQDPTLKERIKLLEDSNEKLQDSIGCLMENLNKILRKMKIDGHLPAINKKAGVDTT